METGKDDHVSSMFCEKVQQVCATRMKERYESMKELFNSKLNNISLQLESALNDIQKPLSNGSSRMKSIEDNHRKDIKELQELIVEAKRIPWQLVSIIVVICLAVGSSLALSWRQTGIHEYRLNKVQTAVEDLHEEIDEIQKNISDL